MIDAFYSTKHGQLFHGDNIEVMKQIESNSVDSCISDFPYAIEFMGKQWDSSKSWHDGEGKHSEFQGTGYTGKRRPNFYTNTPNDLMKFYDWCYVRALELFRIMKPGGYIAIFGHPKTNHRMKCAFEDAGFMIVEEIDYLHCQGMPKSQDIGKMFDRAAGAEREVVMKLRGHTGKVVENHQSMFDDDNYGWAGEYSISRPSTEQAKKWDGWKTAGLKPSHEPITIFQKPMVGTYLQNIEQYGCGAMNIDACRVPISQEDIDMLNAKASKHPTTNYSDSDGRIYGKYAADMAMPAHLGGRFPPNIIIDEYTAVEIDKQTGITKSTGGSGEASTTGRARNIYGAYNREINDHYQNDSLGGYGDSGGGSRMFPIFKYCPKASPSERQLPNGKRNPHVTLKPVELIKWLIKLLTPTDGLTIDITAGSCTHAVACEALNHDDGYHLKWINIELCNDEENPYCEVGKLRIEHVNDGKQKKLF